MMHSSWNGRIFVRLGMIAMLALMVGASSSAQGLPPAAGRVGETVTPSPNQSSSPPLIHPAQVAPSTTEIGTPTQPLPDIPIPPGYIAQSINVVHCATPPKIDGSLDDACWKTATHVVGFYPYGTLAPIKARNQTEAWICADSTRLYVAFHCEETSKIVATQTQRNGNIFKDDFAGFDVDSQDRQRSYSTFLVTPMGVQFSQIEGGTASNITWAGDWEAAGRKTADGYNIEMSIPFGLLKYPKGAHTFGILFYRNISGQVGLQSWPYNPISDATATIEGQFMAQVRGLALPYYAPRPTFLPYTLATVGNGYSVRNGLDIKYPLSTTLTGVASFYPDLDTIEQNIESIQFSYDQKLLTDNRPFFAEGNSYLPDNDLYYSRTIGQFDQGIKLVGKDADTSIGVLATNYHGVDSQDESAMNIRQDFGPYRDLGVEYVDDIQAGQPSNQVGRIYGGYTFLVPHDQVILSALHTQSYDGGDKESGSDNITLADSSQNTNQPYYSLQYVDIGPNFDSNLGYVPELDKRGTALVFGETTVASKGPIAVTNFELDADQFQHHTGGFFHDDGTFTYYIQTKSGLSYAVIPEVDQRDEFHDYNNTAQFQYGMNTLYQQGTLSDTFGRNEDMPYNFLSYSQGIYVARSVSAQLAYSREALGASVTNQTILTGNYRLTAERTIGCRVVNQSGATNIFVSFAQQARTGTDVFLLFGDPNANSTVGEVTVKLAHPF